MLLTSPKFSAGDELPADFTRKAANLSPPLSWTDLPTDTASLALICVDPDAERLWYHWVLWNIDPNWPGLIQGFPKLRDFQLARQGRNTFGKLGYDGPEPPAGETHRYFFRLYALDRQLNLASGAPGPQLERAMQGKILAQSELKVLYTAVSQPSYSSRF